MLKHSNVGVVIPSPRLYPVPENVTASRHAMRRLKGGFVFTDMSGFSVFACSCTVNL